MKKQDVQIGAEYSAGVSGRVAVIRIDRESPHGGWVGTNMVTGRTVRIRSAARLRAEAPSGSAAKWAARRAAAKVRRAAEKTAMNTPDPTTV